MFFEKVRDIIAKQLDIEASTITMSSRLIDDRITSYNVCYTKLLRPVIVNMEELELDTAQRILDFLSGAVYALNGRNNFV